MQHLAILLYFFVISFWISLPCGLLGTSLPSCHHHFVLQVCSGTMLFPVHCMGSLLVFFVCLGSRILTLHILSSLLFCLHTSSAVNVHTSLQLHFLLKYLEVTPSRTLLLLAELFPILILTLLLSVIHWQSGCLGNRRSQLHLCSHPGIRQNILHLCSYNSCASAKYKSFLFSAYQLHTHSRHGYTA